MLQERPNCASELHLLPEICMHSTIAATGLALISTILDHEAATSQFSLRMSATVAIVYARVCCLATVSDCLLV